MRRLFACATVAAALAAVPAAAEPGVCTPTSARVGACAEYVCVDICAPEIVVTTWCETNHKICSVIPG